MRNERLIDMLHHLPPGSTVSTSSQFAQRIGRSVQNASILQARALVIETGYQDNEAELSLDGKTIQIYADGKWFPLPAFTIEQGMKFDPAESVNPL